TSRESTRTGSAMFLSWVAHTSLTASSGHSGRSTVGRLNRLSRVSQNRAAVHTEGSTALSVILSWTVQLTSVRDGVSHMWTTVSLTAKADASIRSVMLEFDIRWAGRTCRHLCRACRD